MTLYDVGDRVKTTATFRNEAGVPTDTTVDVKLIDPLGVVTDLSETHDGPGVYSAVFTPTRGGRHVVQWIGTGTVEQMQKVRVTVTGDPADLCSVDDVKLALERATDESDERIADMIMTASSAILRFASREFAPASNAVARTVWYEGGILSLGTWDLRAATSVQIDTDGVTPTTLAASDYQLRPRSASVFSYLLLPRHMATPASPRQVTITGDWGFPVVPADIRRACVVTVTSWIDRAFTEYAEAESPGSYIPLGGTTYAIPLSARRLIEPYRRMPV